MSQKYVILISQIISKLHEASVHLHGRLMILTITVFYDVYGTMDAQ